MQQRKGTKKMAQTKKTITSQEQKSVSISENMQYLIYQAVAAFLLFNNNFRVI